MLSFDEYVKSIGRYAFNKTEDELRVLHRTDMTLFAFAYKRWLELERADSPARATMGTSPWRMDKNTSI
jgi:hypothetical protein